jgi:hypothetical protein
MLHQDVNRQGKEHDKTTATTEHPVRRERLPALDTPDAVTVYDVGQSMRTTEFTRTFIVLFKSDSLVQYSRFILAILRLLKESSCCLRLPCRHCPISEQLRDGAIS